MSGLGPADIGAAPVTVADLAAEHAARVAAVLDATDDVAAGRPLPLLWHWAFFAPAVPTADLGTDGHPPLPVGGPTAGLPRRMWAGGRVEALGPLVIGRPATRRSQVVAAQRKRGRSGELMVVTARHSIEQAGRVVLVEEQDLVYRQAVSAVTAAPAPEEAPPVPPGGWAEEVTASPTLLFRYSAVTFNSHRIHYDQAYASAVEGYPGLVVHGPLTATLLAASARRQGRQGTSFRFRAAAPLFAGLPFSLVGQPDAEGVSLRAVRSDGVEAMTAHLG